MKYDQLPDESLVALVARKDKLALEALYDRHSRAVYSLALRIIRNRYLAEEVTQEVFLNLWLKASSYKEDKGRFLSWLLSITHHRTIDEVRRNRREGAQPIEEGIPERNMKSASDTEESSLTSLEGKVIREALRELPEPQRQVLLLIYFEGFTQSEISQRLNIPLGTVKTRARLGLNRLKELLKSQKV